PVISRRAWSLVVVSAIRRRLPSHRVQPPRRHLGPRDRRPDQSDRRRAIGWRNRRRLGPAWLDVPTRVLVCRDDRLFPTGFLRRVGPGAPRHHAGRDRGGHTALSRPHELVDRLEAYAAKLGLLGATSIAACLPMRSGFLSAFDALTGRGAEWRGAIHDG